VKGFENPLQNPVANGNDTPLPPSRVESRDLPQRGRPQFFKTTEEVVVDRRPAKGVDRLLSEISNEMAELE